MTKDETQEVGLLTIGLLYASLKANLTDFFETKGFFPQNYNLDSIISPQQIRNIVIRQEYYEQRQEGIKAESLYISLADKYGLTNNFIRHIVHNRK